MKITYLGATDAVDLTLPDRRVTVAHGECVDAPAQIAKNLLANGDWKQTTPAGRGKKGD